MNMSKFLKGWTNSVDWYRAVPEWLQALSMIAMMGVLAFYFSIGIIICGVFILWSFIGDFIGLLKED